MSVPKALRVRNLRSFGESNGFVPLLPINILVGRNSCGKSTFLRTFPLLRQSMQADTKSPILWYGNFVDFGDLNSAKNLAADNVCFDFKLDISVNASPNFLMEGSALSKLKAQLLYFTSKDFSPNKQVELPIDFTLCIRRLDSGLISNVLRVQLADLSIELGYNEDSCNYLSMSVKGGCIWSVEGESKIVEKGKLIPTDFRNPLINEKNPFYRFSTVRSEIKKSFVEYVYTFHHANKAKEKVAQLLEGVAFDSKDNVGRQVRSIFKADKYFSVKAKEAGEQFDELCHAYVVGMSINKILSAIDSELAEFYSGVRYLGPVRAVAERYYRYQDLQVGEIDHTGSNLPMVLNSLGDIRRKELNDWIKENFDFEIKLAETASHYALYVKEETDLEFHNISDMGFGYSQILPIIVSIWLEAQNSEQPAAIEKSVAKQYVVAIEQPELHLHPKLQHQFGRVIAKTARAVKHAKIVFVLETHSRHIIDAIGECVEDGLISRDDVNITLFEKDKEGLTRTSLSSFDEKGYLTNWPAGFLSP